MIVAGTPGGDNLLGTADDDEFYGRGGDDFLFGFSGDDLFVWDAGRGNTSTGRPTIENSDGSDTIDGGDGTDRLLVVADYFNVLTGRNSDTGLITHSLEAGPDGTALLVARQTWNAYAFTPPSGVSVTTVTMRNVEQLSYNGRLEPEPDSGSPIVQELTRESVTVGDLRTTALTGLLVFSFGAGEDRLDASAAYNDIVALGGDNVDQLIGGAGNDELHGDNGNDILDGGGGLNILIGGQGNDSYFSDDPRSSVIELAGEGSDSIYTRAGYYSMSDNVESLYAIGTASFIGIGNQDANEIWGSAPADYLIGQGGNDKLYGNFNPDLGLILTPGAADSFQGGTGSDTYYVTNAGDTVIEFAGEGFDTIVSILAVYQLQSNVENLQYYDASGIVVSLNWRGNELDNVIQGGGGPDTLYGLDGNDTLIGGGVSAGDHNTLYGGRGDDIYRVSQASDVVVELAGEGLDTVELWDTAFTLCDAVERLVVKTGSNTVVGGNAGGNELTGGSGRDNLAGFSGNDILTGGANHDSLSGYDGDDVLNGGLGADEMSGGTGADRFVFADVSDKDLVHDFNRPEGDKVDVSALLAGVGFSRSDPFADGHLTISSIAAFGSSGVPASLVRFDPDGVAGPLAAQDLVVFLGGTAVVAPGDFIF